MRKRESSWSTSDGRNKQQVADDPGFPQHDFSWSPDSRWLTYSTENPNGYRSLYIWDSESGKSQRVTNEMFSAYNPVFAPGGGQLYFLSNRMFAFRSSTCWSGTTRTIAAPASMR